MKLDNFIFLILYFPILLFGIGVYGLGAVNKILILTMLFIAAFLGIFVFEKNENFNHSSLLQLFLLAIFGLFFIPPFFCYENHAIKGVMVDAQIYLYTFLLSITILISSAKYLNTKLSYDYFLNFMNLALLLHILISLLNIYITNDNVWRIHNNREVLNFAWSSAPSSIFYLVVLISNIVSILNAKPRRTFIFFASLSFLLLVLTKARAPIFCGILSLIIFIWGGKRFNYSSKFILVSVCVLLITSILAASSQMFLEFPWINEFIIEVNFSGRISIWEILLPEITQKPFVGHGYGAATGFIQNNFQLGGLSIEDQPHNDYLRILYNNGVFGMVTFILFLMKVNSSQKNIQSNFTKANKFFILNFLLLMVFDNPLTYHFFLYPMLLTGLIGCLDDSMLIADNV